MQSLGERVYTWIFHRAVICTRLMTIWENDSKIMATTIIVKITINVFPFILSFFAENVIGKGGIARALNNLLWIFPSTSISANFFLHISCTERAGALCERLVSWATLAEWMLKPLQQCCSQVVSSFSGLQRSQLFQSRITGSTYPDACISSQKLEASLSFVSLFFCIYYISPSVLYYQALHSDTGQQSLSLQTALNLNDSGHIW